jgi:hypothetical protein
MAGAVPGRSGGQPGAFFLLGDHRVKLAAYVGLDRGIGRDPLDGALKIAAVIAKLIGGQRVNRMPGRPDGHGAGDQCGSLNATCPRLMVGTYLCRIA